MKVIGIAGPSCSGKSTISKLVANEIDAKVTCLDYQFTKGLPHIYVDNVRTFERAELYNGAELARIAKEWKAGNRVEYLELRNKQIHPMKMQGGDYLILEGFLLYAYPQIREVCDTMFYIDLPWNEMVKRRLARPTHPAADAGFFAIGQKELETYVLPQKEIPGVIVLDGMLDPQTIASSIVQRVIKN